MNCQHCQPLLLDHLYGLLDEPEVAAVDAHLASCPACAAAYTETARVQGLIARAAKSAFPQTRFEVPAEAPANGGAAAPVPAAPAPPFVPKAEPKPDRGFRFAAVLPWAVAAAVLVAIPGTVVPVLDLFDRAERARHEAEIASRDAEVLAGTAESVREGVQRRQTDAEFKVTVAEQNQTALLNHWFESQKAAAQSVTTRKLTVDVQKPATVQPGAPNDFVVVVNDHRDQWERSGKRMVAEVHAVSASDAVIFSQPLDSERAADKTHSLRLPAGVWTKVTPDAELFLVVAQVDEKTQTRVELLDRVKLAGPVFTTLLVTDKSAYRPGERLFFRSLTLDRITFRPPGREQVLRYELRHPDGRPVAGLNVAGTTDLVRLSAEGKVEPVRAADGQPVRGVGCGEFVLPPDLADGDYALVLRELFHPGGFPATVPAPVTRQVRVRSAAPDHFRKLVGFSRASFAPGEIVDAWAELAFQDRPVPGADVLAVAAEVDGQPLDRIDAAKTTNANGRANFRFTLPAEVHNGDVRVKVTFRTPLGAEEVVARRVPVVGRRLIVEFFPECGDSLVAGVPCKVYVRATTPAGIPVDVRGTITDGRRELARVETLTDRNEPGANRGLAAFTYTPELGTRVWLKLESPAGALAPILPDAPVANAAVALVGGPAAAGARTGYPLPAPKAEGVVMTVLDPVTAPGQPVRVRLHSVGQPRRLVVGAYTRGRLSDTQKVTVDPELPQTVNLMAGADPRGGVVRVTVFEEVEDKARADDKAELKPVAERLVFRKPGEALNLTCTVAPAEGRGLGAALSPNALALPSGSQVKLSLTATDEKGDPAAAILWAAAVNTGAAPGPKDRLMPTHFLLAGEVKKPDDLEHADFLLTDHPKAAEALDLLLGTQGWRRFAEQQPAPVDAVRTQPAVPNLEIARLHAQNGQYAVAAEPSLVHENRKLVEKFGPRYEAAVQALAQARAKLEAARAEAQNPQPIWAAAEAAEVAKRAAAETTARAEAARGPVRRFRANAWYGVAGLFLLALCCGAVAAVRPSDRFPLGFGTLGSLGLAAFLVVAASWVEDARAATGAEGAKAERPRNAPVPVAVTRDAIESEEAATVGLAMGKAEAAVTTGVPSRGDGAPAKGGVGGFGGPPGAAAPEPPKAPPAPGAGGGVGGLPEPKAKLHMTPFTIPVEPAPAALPGAPNGPGAAAAKDGKVEPRSSNGVTASDLLAGQTTLQGAAKGDANRALEQADELKRAADRATAYANNRANSLAAAMDAYFHQREQAKPAAAGASVPADKVPDLERFVAGQLRGSVTRQQPPLVVREFAAPRPAAPVSADDTADTVLWQPVIVLPADGKTTLNFHLGAAPGGYQVVIAGHTADGRLGAVRGLILTTPPRTIEPDAPGGAVPRTVPVAPAPPRAP